LSTEVEKMEERMIDLGKIDHGQQYFHDAIGIPFEEYERCFQEISNYKPLRIQMELDKLGFSKEEIVKSSKNAQYDSEAVMELWKRRGREKISLKEFILTVKLVQKAYREKGILGILEIKTIEIEGSEGILKRTAIDKINEGLIERTRKRVIEFVRDRGIQVWKGTASCDKWLSEHGTSRGCPSELGCAKAILIMNVVIKMTQDQPRSLKNFVEIHLSINMTIAGMELITEILAAKSLKELEKNLKKLQEKKLGETYTF